MTKDESSAAQPIRRRPVAALVVVGVFGLAAIFAYATGLHRAVNLTSVIEHRLAITAFVAEHRFTAFAAFVALYIVMVALSFPGATLLTVAGGLVFGALDGMLGALLGATAGGSLVFLLARSAVGGWLVVRAGAGAQKLADGFRRDAFHYLLFLRLLPVFPFWLVNIVPAMLGVRFSTFLAATALGIIPGTAAFALFGAGLDSTFASQAAALQACRAARGSDCQVDFSLHDVLTPQLVAALVVLAFVALLPVAVKKWKGARGRRLAQAAPDVPAAER